MTFSVDDLVASFSSSHVGQEAIDLAALQAQLAQTLAAQHHSSSTNSQAHCTTPTARTPTMSFANWEPRRSRSTSVTMGARRGAHSAHDSDTIIEESMDEDDEFAVEQLIGGPGLGGPMRYTRERGDSVSLSMQAQAPWATPMDNGHFAVAHETRAYFAGSELPEHATPSPSSFATSDPFYAAVEASCQQQMHPHQVPRPGFFVQMAARPGVAGQQQSSPFYAAQSLGSTSAAGFDTLTHTHAMEPRTRFTVITGTVDA